MDQLYRVLGEKYSGHQEAAADINALLAKYREYRATALLDIASVATALTIADLRGDEVDPLVMEAVQMTNPNFDPTESYSDEELIGIVNSAKGKYFELLVAERLNDGLEVGDIVLPDGYTAHVAESLTQPGWDLQILGPNDDVQQYLQLKATDNVAYVTHALEQYPDIKILATTEAAAKMSENQMVIDSNISEDELRKAVLDGTGAGGFLDLFWEAFAPAVPLMLIAGMAGYRVIVGKQTVRDAAEVAQARAFRAAVSLGVGAVVKAAGGGWVSIPAAIIAGYSITNLQKIDELVDVVGGQKKRLDLQLRYYAAST